MATITPERNPTKVVAVELVTTATATKAGTKRSPIKEAVKADTKSSPTKEEVAKVDIKNPTNQVAAAPRVWRAVAPLQIA
jgi:uncharacterized membrane protein